EKNLYGTSREASRDLSKIDSQFEEIAAILLKNQESIANIAELLEKVFSVRSDLNGDNPNKEAIGEKINTIASSVSSVTKLVTKLNALKEAIFAIL
ncbi:MAG: hypothetical protein WBL87_02880, partial [Methanothrix sp.]